MPALAAPAVPEAPAAQPAPAPASTASASASASTLCVSSARLFGHATEIHIDHHGAIYRLKHTSSGKLILTK